MLTTICSESHVLCHTHIELIIDVVKTVYTCTFLGHVTFQFECGITKYINANAFFNWKIAFIAHEMFSL